MKPPLPLALFAMSLTFQCNAQLFTKITPQGAVGLTYSHNAWVDFDADGDLDIFVNGAASLNDLKTMIYKNNGNDNFAVFTSQPFLPQYSESEIAFINLNGDNWIDILLMGRRIGNETTNRISQLQYGTTGYTDLGTIPDFGKAQGYGTISVGDVNGDGTQDVFLCGYYDFNETGLPVKAVMYARKDNTYSILNNTFDPAVFIGASRLADFDNDDDLDLLLCGGFGNGADKSTILYYNDGKGTFTPSGLNLDGFSNASIDLADFDGDHRLDILMSGIKGNNYVTQLYQNSVGSFTTVTFPPAVNRTASGSARWGDYDNDGDPDILITGQVGDAKKLALFQNNDGVFTEIMDNAFETIGLGQANWGDYDNDGDLDILVTGASDLDQNTNELSGALYVLKNGAVNKNTKPNAPSNFSVTATDENSVSMTWDPSTDDRTESAALTYNISVRETSTDKYLVHPFSDDLTGRRSVMEPGNVWLNLSRSIDDLKQGTWLFKVQSIDAGFTASDWSPVKTIYVGNPAAPSNLIASYADGKMIVSWRDNSINEEFFVIERKSGTGEFVTVGQATSNISRFEETISVEGTHQYRVYAVNPNSSSTYSNIVSYLIMGLEDKTETSATLYPNPTTGSMYLTAKVLANTEIASILLDSKGSNLKTIDLRFNNEGQASIDLQDVPAGLFILKIQDDRITKNIKVIKQ